MSRETLRGKLLETVKEIEKETVGFLKSEANFLKLEQDIEEEGHKRCEDYIQEYAYLIEFRNFLENEKYDPFTDYSAKYGAGAVPAYPEGKTFYYLDDTDIGIIEEDVRAFVFDVITFMFRSSADRVWAALQPDLIRSNYISVIERCVYEKRREKAEEKQ